MCVCVCVNLRDRKSVSSVCLRVRKYCVYMCEVENALFGMCVRDGVCVCVC